MINYETLLSSYDDKLTLMQWLKKVEAALKDASAVSFNVNKRGDATLTFSVVFEDGSELESGPIVLQQGESVTAAHMAAGHLILTLSNGDELDAGNLGAVSGMFINASQHLIVTYQDGTTQDLGAIFAGNVVINGNFEVTGRAKLPTIDGDANGRLTIDADVIINDGDLTLTDGTLSTPVITSSGDKVEALKPVVETMSGYSARVHSDIASWTKTIAYVGACKNGNKLTLVACIKFTLPEGAFSQPSLINFTIPSSIGARLIPINIPDYGYLDQKNVALFTSPNDFTSAVVRLGKDNNTSLNLILRTTTLTANTEYLLRYEATFLLGDSLI